MRPLAFLGRRWQVRQASGAQDSTSGYGQAPRAQDPVAGGGRRRRRRASPGRGGRRRGARGELSLIPVEGLPEIREGDDLGRLIAGAATLEDGDVVVVAHKAVSKAEGRVVRLDDVEPSPRALELAGEDDARRIEVILAEAKRIVRARPPLVIAETRHGFVCASAGVDASNAPEAGMVVLLPVDPDASAAAIRERLRELTRKAVAVVVADSFGRPWRTGIVDVAIGVSGLAPLIDYRGGTDRVGYELRATVVAVADEIAAAADLVRGKTSGVPVVLARGLDLAGAGSARDLVMPPERDLFQ